MMSRLSTLLRNHIPFFIVVPLLIIIMTWPTIVYVFDSETFAVPTRNTDVWQKLWDVWHGEQFLAGRTSFYHSNAMFYPGGISLAYENFSLPHMLSVALLGTILPTSNAFNLTYLFIVFAVALSGYVYLNYLFRDRWLATMGAVVFGLSQHVTAHAAHPDINLIVSFPLAMYCFQRAMTEARLKYLLVCGIIVGFTAFLSLYIFVCLLITLALIVLYYARERWKDLRFWRWMLLLGLVILLFSAGRITPMLAGGKDLASAIGKNPTQETGTDLLSYFVNYWHPLTTPLLKTLFGAGSPFYEPHTSYLGYLPLALIMFGFTRSDCRRKMLPWLALALPFLLLRLGSVLQVDGQQFSHIVLPKALLADLLPALFSPFHATDHFQMGLLLPWAVMSCYGLKSLLAARRGHQRALIVLAVIALIAFEYYESTAMRVLPPEQIAFIEWLRGESDDAEPRLINLPMGRQPSKLYGFYQSLTAFPQVEGLTGRTPPSAYAYIDGNYLLSAWRGGAAIHCFPPHQAIYLDSLNQLRDDGFSHVIWHGGLGQDIEIASSFIDAQSAYSDDYVSVFRLEDLRQACELPNSVSAAALEQLRSIESAPAIIPQTGSAILSILPADGQYNAALFGLHRYASLTLAAGKVATAPGADAGALDVAGLLAGNSVILLVYNPQLTEADAIQSYRAWLADRFQSCRRLTGTDEALVELFLDAAFPCELAISAAPLEVRYENGIQLGNLLLESSDGALDLYLLWTRLPADAHAVSFQFLDADGARAGGEDFVIGQEPLAHYRIDTSSLTAGDYQVKMILYDYDSGASVAGTVSASQARFDRALRITNITANPSGRRE
ncbi:MAG: hypothetical protein OXG49_18130 [Chloroflexi bacterium]|nr:hypothetical protein [Chloroflexota bacterium]